MSALEVLQKYWGYSGFRACQQVSLCTRWKPHTVLALHCWLRRVVRASAPPQCNCSADRAHRMW